MSLEETLFSRLSGFAGITALVPAARITPNTLPQGTTYPAISYRRVTTLPYTAMGADTGVTRARVQVDIWGKNYSVLDSVGEQVRAALQRWRHTSPGTEVLSSFYVNAVDLYEPENEIHHRAMDFEIDYRE